MCTLILYRFTMDFSTDLVYLHGYRVLITGLFDRRYFPFSYTAVFTIYVNIVYSLSREFVLLSVFQFSYDILTGPMIFSFKTILHL